MKEFDLLSLLDDSPQGRFERFHRDNPAVYSTLVRLARAKIARTGCAKLGMQQLFEVLRWDISMTTGDDDFKINNNYAAWYARMIMELEPDLIGRFEVRKSNADGEW